MSMEQSNTNELVQNVRDFTVQIRRTDNEKIVGTGFVVSMQGHIVTCKHVVEAAGVEPRTGRRIQGFWARQWERLFHSSKGADVLNDAKGAKVGVYFPQVLSGERQDRHAVVVGCFLQHDDDVVLLQLLDGPAPLAPEQIAVLGRAELSKNHEFQSYGYCRLDKYNADWARGRIYGSVEAPRGRKLQVEPVQLESKEVDRGMSGAAVLDERRNLVVGVISEVNLLRSMKNRDTCWAVNARALSLEPLNLSLQDEPHPLRPAPQPRTDVTVARAATNPQPGYALHGAPPAITEELWAGRVDLLSALNTDWAAPACHVSELIGFGGEGKSSVARYWLDRLLNDGTQPQPDGVFWWNCYDNRSVDALFEAALQYLSSGLIDPRQLTSSNVRAQVIGAMLGARRYLFVLDGLEMLQHQEGDAYGLLVNADLRELLGYFGASGHNSFCLVTSRAPLFDLISYITFRRHDVERLSQEDGRDLLRKLGVHGADAAIDLMVADWDGHALTLSLLGGYLVERYRGDIAHIADLPAPIANEPRYERVQRVLRRYDDHLSEAERAFLLVFSAFRLPVHESALAPVFRMKSQDAANTLTANLAALNDQDFDDLLERLRTYHLLTYDVQNQRYTTHPLIRAYYAARLNERESEQVQAVHARIKDYYLAIAGDISEHPTLSELVPLIEAVHHACGAGNYDEAFGLFWQRIHQGGRRVLFHELGAYETALALLVDFFPNRDIEQEPLVSTPGDRNFVQNEVGFCLIGLGRLAKAVPLLERCIPIAIDMQDWGNASAGYRNLAALHIHHGALADSAETAYQALLLAQRIQDKHYECNSLAWQARAAYLRGELQVADAAFQQAEALEREYNPNVHYLYNGQGIHHAEHLRRVGQTELARDITETNLEICRLHRWLDDESQCHCVLGDLAADVGEYQRAQQQYDEALSIARSISRRDILIQALLAWGRFAAKRGESEAARSYLDEALGYAVTSEYRLYEADIRVVLAWAYRAAGNMVSAGAQAERALRMSEEMGYYWGRVDAEEVLATIEGKGH